MATTNLNLPQWELSDPILMEQFNNAFQSIDQFAGTINQTVAEINQLTLLWEGSFSFGNPITLSESAFNFIQLWIPTSGGITLMGAISPVVSNITDFTAIATGPFAGGGEVTIYGFYCVISENGLTLTSPFCYSQEIGGSSNTPITPTAIYGVGRRNASIDPVLMHNNSSLTHLNMIVDGNNSDVTDASSSLQEHIVSPQAHQNLIIDGNEN